MESKNKVIIVVVIIAIAAVFGYLWLWQPPPSDGDNGKPPDGGVIVEKKNVTLHFEEMLEFSEASNKVIYVEIPKDAEVLNAEMRLGGLMHGVVGYGNYSSGAWTGRNFDFSKGWKMWYGRCPSQDPDADICFKSIVVEEYMLKQRAQAIYAETKNISVDCSSIEYGESVDIIDMNMSNLYNPYILCLILCVKTKEGNYGKLLLMACGPGPYNWTYYSYPTNLTVDIGNDGIKKWGYGEKLNTTETIKDISSQLNSLSSNCYCNRCRYQQGNCSIPIVVHSDSVGKLNVSVDIEAQIT